MKRIGNSKEPTPKQMLAIASNLQTHLNTFVSVIITADSYDHTGMEEVEYSLWIASMGRHHNFKSWPKLLTFYRKIMKEGLESVS